MTDSSQAVDLMIGVGVLEVVLGIAVLYRPLRRLLVLVLVWKLGTELLRPLVGQPNHQFVERAGDYVLPLALFWLVGAVLPARRARWADPFGRQATPNSRRSTRTPLEALPKGAGDAVSWFSVRETKRITCRAQAAEGPKGDEIHERQKATFPSPHQTGFGAVSARPALRYVELNRC